jgi:hypothetical protein
MMLECPAQRSNVTMLGLIYADEFRLIAQTGLVRTKEDQLRDYEHGLIRYGAFDLLEREIKVYGAAAIVWSRERAVILLPDRTDVGGDRCITRMYIWNGRQFNSVRHPDAAGSLGHRSHGPNGS